MQESKTGIIEFPEDDPVVMPAMLAFIYQSDYALEVDPNTDDYHTVNAVMHGQLCLAAKKYNINGLTALAQSKMKLEVATYL